MNAESPILEAEPKKLILEVKNVKVVNIGKKAGGKVNNMKMHEQLR